MYVKIRQDESVGIGKGTDLNSEIVFSFTEAKEVAAAQFRQYGLNNLPDEHLENYAKEILKSDEERKKLYEKKFEDKVIEFIKESVKVENKEITTEEFNNLFAKK